ncbi:hypothetical protein JCM11251_002037 [Rhodosporidiobolus azoricus]
MSNYNKEQLEAQIDKAFKTRLEGNEKFKSGDLVGALRDYHTVLLSLKGATSLESQIGQIYPKPLPPVTGPTDEEEKKTAGEAPLSKADEVKQAILNTHLNSAAVHIKRENWKRALECALQAKKMDEKNPKAAFREAQARIHLGEVNAGKKMLEDLNKTNPDAAIAAELQKLKLNEKTTGSKVAAGFRGMYNKKSANGSPSPPNTEKAGHGASTAGASNPVGAKAASAAEGPKIVELDD